MDLIAEIGWNHMGDMSLAERMISAAKWAGATHAKFQTWHESQLKPGPWDKDGRREIYRKAELSQAQFSLLKKMCNTIGLEFLTSLFNVLDVDFMATVDRAAIKIPSPEVANEELIRSAARKFEKVYLSTGASTEQEIDRALEIVRKEGTPLVLMHCVSLYPCPDNKVNLPRIKALMCKHKSIGFSDHTPDNLSAILSLPLGVVAIEKHFTIDNDLPGRDNKFALLPNAFSEIAEAARRFAEMSYDHGIDYQPEEKEVREVYRGRWSGSTA